MRARLASGNCVCKQKGRGRLGCPNRARALTEQSVGVRCGEERRRARKRPPAFRRDHAPKLPIASKSVSDAAPVVLVVLSEPPICVLRGRMSVTVGASRRSTRHG